MCATLLLAGCHGTPATSGYGIVWVTLTNDEPGRYFTSYNVTVDSITMTRNDGQEFTALATPEIVDFTQIQNIAELWGSAAIPEGTYVSATITLDYTDAQITVSNNGTPVLATVVDAVTGSTSTTYAITVLFDGNDLPTITPTYASTSATLIAIDLDLQASNQVQIPASGTPTVTVRPYVTAGSHASDNKLIRVRGPLINSSTDVESYTVYVRPFYDEANNIGELTLFSTDSTVYTINGNTYVGAAGLDVLSNLSAGTTMTAGYAQLQTDYNPLNGAHAGRFNLAYVVGGSTLEDQYTEGISGDVTHRTGNTLTLHGSTLFLNTADTFSYLTADAQVLLGPGTIVTADDNTTLTGLTSASIAVGDHITVRGEYSVASDNTTIIDATGTKATNTGSVRLQTNELWGPLVSSTTGGLTMDVQTINRWPIDIYDFSGNGATAAQNPLPDSFLVDTVTSAGSLSVPAGTVAGDPVWVNGYFAAFGKAPPDFNAVAVNNEYSVQLAGTQLGGGVPSPGPAGPGTQYCGVGSQVCDPATLTVVWKGTSTSGTGAPFSAYGNTYFVIDTGNKDFVSGVIQIGPEAFAFNSPSNSPTVMGITAANANPTTFLPRYSIGNPATATSTSTFTSTSDLDIVDTMPEFISEVEGHIAVSNPALALAARGLYDRANNTFYATAIDFVL